MAECHRDVHVLCDTLIVVQQMSMVHAMELSEAQKESFLEAKRSMTREYEAIISTRMRCTAELKKVSGL